LLGTKGPLGFTALRGETKIGWERDRGYEKDIVGKVRCSFGGFEWKSSDIMLALTAAVNAEFEAHFPREDTIKFKKADGITPFFNGEGMRLLMV